MKIEQIYTKCLAQGSYYLQNNGIAAVIDPLREVDLYLEMAKNDNAQIQYIFETHFHADFVSGHLTLAEKTGATIVYGPYAHPDFKAYIAKDNENFSIGHLTIKVLHTPGHTMESVVYLLLDAKQKQKAIFTGDTLFLGDVGRPDLAQKNTMTKEQLAGILYDSLQEKIMPLEDDIIVYPGHGAGSACGKNMMKQTTDTLGNQKKINYALQKNLKKEIFIQELLMGLPAPPPYFGANVKMNTSGYPTIDKVLKDALNPIAPIAFKEAMIPSTIILDVRKPEDFCKGHIPESIFIGLEGNFAPWVGTLLADVKMPILLVTPKGKEKEAVMRLARVGFDNVLGYLDSLELWKENQLPLEKIKNISAKELQKYDYKKNIFDVRTLKEYKTKHVKNAFHIPLSNLKNELKNLQKNQQKFVYCAGGYRSVIACSILKKQGHQNIINIEGGFGKIKENNAVDLQ